MSSDSPHSSTEEEQTRPWRDSSAHVDIDDWLDDLQAQSPQPRALGTADGHDVSCGPERGTTSRDAMLAALHAYREQPDSAQWDALEALAGRNNAWQELATAYEALAPRFAGGARAEAWLRLGKVYADRLSLPERAIETANRALVADPLSVRAREFFHGLLRTTGRWSDLVAALGEAMDGASDMKRDLIRRELAHCYERELGNATGAIEQYEALLEDHPADINILRSLGRLYASEGRTRAQVRVLSNLAALSEDDYERAELNERLAALWKRLGDAQQAAHCLEWRISLTHAPDALYEELVELYRASGNHPAELDVFRRWFERARGPARTRLLSQMAHVYEHALADPYGAIECYRESLASLDDPAPALDALARLYCRVDEPASEGDALRQRAELPGDTLARVEMLYRAAELSMRAQDLGGAEAALDRALELDDTHAPTVRARACLHRQQGDYLAASDLLESALPLQTCKAARTALLVDAAAVRGLRGDDDEACDLFMQALALGIRDSAVIARAGELLYRAARFDELVRIHKGFTPPTESPDVEAARLTRLGEAACAVGDIELAVRVLGRAVERGGQLASRRALATALCAAESWAAARDELTRLLCDHARDLDECEQTALHVQLARCHRLTGQFDQARQDLEAALMASTFHPAALHELELLARTEHERAIEDQRTRARTAPPDQRAALLVAIGDRYRFELMDHHRAAAAYREALDLAPGDDHVRRKYVETTACGRATTATG